MSSRAAAPGKAVMHRGFLLLPRPVSRLSARLRPGRTDASSRSWTAGLFAIFGVILFRLLGVRDAAAAEKIVWDIEIYGPPVRY